MPNAKEITADELDAEMLSLLSVTGDPNVEIVDHLVDYNAEHGSNPELEDPEEVKKL